MAISAFYGEETLSMVLTLALFALKAMRSLPKITVFNRSKSNEASAIAAVTVSYTAMFTPLRSALLERTLKLLSCSM